MIGAQLCTVAAASFDSGIFFYQHLTIHLIDFFFLFAYNEPTNNECSLGRYRGPFFVCRE
jgi:hypothetical protein